MLGSGENGSTPIRGARWRLGLTAAGLIAGCALASTPGMAQGLKFPAGDWLTECASASPPSDCSLTGVLNGVDARGDTGSFAIVVGLETLLVAIVGQPPPEKATLRVDKYPPVECIGPRYCVFSDVDVIKLIQEFGRGTTILVDVFTKNGTFRPSLSAIGYQAGLAKIRATSP